LYFLVYVGTHCADSEPRRGSARAPPNVTSRRGVGTQLFRPFFHPLVELGEVAPVGTDLLQILLVCVGASAHLTFYRGLQAPDHFHVLIIDHEPLRWLLPIHKLTERRVSLLLACHLRDETGLPLVLLA
jgi:hypothetical protein